MRLRTPGRAALLVVASFAASLLVACGSAPPSVAPPTPRPTPVITPDPHLDEPTTADKVFLGLAREGLTMTANNAVTGKPGTGLVKRINATYLGWPLAVIEYATTEDLSQATAWKPDVPPDRGEPPVSIAGLNILVEWGPTTGAAPLTPEGAQLEALDDLATSLDRLLSPLRARATVAIPGTGVEAAADPSAEPTPKP